MSVIWKKLVLWALVSKSQLVGTTTLIQPVHLMGPLWVTKTKMREKNEKR